MELVAPEIVILTETNVPHEKYLLFRKGDEAHAVYQFSLPPLLLHGLLRETSSQLTEWAKKSSTTSKKGCHFLNFTASHDGIGVRPLEGILPQNEILSLANEIGEKGGLVSMRKMEDGSESPYELNTTYLSALADPKMRASDEPDFYAPRRSPFQ